LSIYFVFEGWVVVCWILLVFGFVGLRSVVGWLNVGKFSLFNKVVGSEWVVVDEVVGTICDLVDELVELGGCVWCFVDIVGICCRVY